VVQQEAARTRTHHFSSDKRFFMHVFYLYNYWHHTYAGHCCVEALCGYKMGPCLFEVLCGYKKGPCWFVVFGYKGALAFLRSCVAKKGALVSGVCYSASPQSDV
jgi:hypothetical protein